ncbi:DUF2971 domain-containing protein [Pseudomonas frederiksbergensis]|uniref:DUF2971 domain-containing protein n=1 Tax=Pseudomonas frederiksbergensis TaxID=104087 RepID=UPI003D1DB4CA
MELAMRRVYHFCPNGHGISNLVNRRLKVSTFTDLNDSFELLCHDAGDEATRKSLNEFKQVISKKSSLLCFSKSFNSPVQWAHYADRHKGLCLGFDVPCDFVGDVRYTARRIQFGAKSKDMKEGFAKQAADIFMTKYKHWSYEEEVRMLGDLRAPDPESGLYFIGFGESLVLKEVVVGSRSNLLRKDVNDALGALHDQVDVFQVRAAFRSYKMVKCLDASLWV